MSAPKSIARTKSPKTSDAVLRKARAARRDAVAEAKALIADVREKKRQISDAFYDIGVALKKLSTTRLYAALGYTSFEALAKGELDLSRTVAYRLMAIADQLTRKRAIELGQTRSLALIGLAAATPEADTAEELARGKVRVPGHHAPLEPGKMSAKAIQRAATVERRSHLKRSAVERAAERWVTARRKKVARFGAEVVLEVRKGQTMVSLRCPFDAIAEVVAILGA
ncbi:MAG: hypothetical protein IPJ34_05375 [Myxococcales bacterium]|nr:hypothetical protein [Myxococcales bacterium]